MEEQTMSQEQFRESKQAGTLYSQPEQVDNEQDYTDTVQADIEPDVEIETDYETEHEVDADGDPLPELTERELTAFQKRMEREDKKLREKFEAEYGEYKKVFEDYGLSPDMVRQGFQQREEQRALQGIMDSNPYISEQEAQMQLNYQRMQISNDIQNLANSGGLYSSAKDMAAPMDQAMRQYGITAQQAFYMVGGEPLAQQIKREEQQREIIKRSTTPRKVVTDHAAGFEKQEYLTPEDVRFAKQNRMSERQVQAMKKLPEKMNLEAFREWNKQNKVR